MNEVFLLGKCLLTYNWTIITIPDVLKIKKMNQRKRIGFSHILDPVLLLILVISPLPSYMSDQAYSSKSKNSSSTIEEAIRQVYLNFETDWLPTRSSSAHNQDSPSTLSSTLPLISQPYEMLWRTFWLCTLRDLPCICQLP